MRRCSPLGTTGGATVTSAVGALPARRGPSTASCSRPLVLLVVLLGCTPYWECDNSTLVPKASGLNASDSHQAASQSATFSCQSSARQHWRLQEHPPLSPVPSRPRGPRSFRARVGAAGTAPPPARSVPGRNTAARGAGCPIHRHRSALAAAGRDRTSAIARVTPVATGKSVNGGLRGREKTHPSAAMGPV